MSTTRTIHADWRDVLPTLADKAYSMAIVDPPYYEGLEQRELYGRLVTSEGINRAQFKVPNEPWEVPTSDYFQELERVSEHQIIWGCNYYDHVFRSGRIIWDKVNQATYYSDCEIAYCSKHDSVRLFRYMWNGMMQGKSIAEGHVMQGNKKLNEKRIHPTQKPILLYKWLFDTYVNQGNTVLDTHLGSGSIRIVAHKLGIEFLGIEKDYDTYMRQEDRFAEFLEKERSEIPFTPYQMVMPVNDFHGMGTCTNAECNKCDN